MWRSTPPSQWTGFRLHCRVSDLNYVWGPVGGSSRTPLALYRYLGVRGVSSELGRIAVTGMLRSIFGVAAARRSSLVLAQNDDVFSRFSVLARTKRLPNAAPEMPRHRPFAEKERTANELIAVGRLLPWKALALHALARPECTHLTLSVYGAGPDEHRLRRMAQKLGLADRVDFLGSRPRAEVLEAMTSAKALVFPSFHDSSPWTVAEALALRCPVVALDLGGSATLLRGAGVGPVPHEGRDLIGRFAQAMVHPPAEGADDVWTPTVFGDGIARALAKSL